MILAPPFRKFTRTFTSRTLTVDDIVNIKDTATTLATCILIDSLLVSIPIAMIVAFFSKSTIGAAVITLMCTALYTVWMTAWFSDSRKEPLLRLLYGGTIFITRESGGVIGTTADVGAIDGYDSVPSAIAVHVPAVPIFFVGTEWELYKPKDRSVTVPRTTEAIRDLLARHAVVPARPIRSSQRQYS